VISERFDNNVMLTAKFSYMLQTKQNALKMLGCFNTNFGSNMDKPKRWVKKCNMIYVVYVLKYNSDI